MTVRRRGPEVVVVGAASRDVAADDLRGWRLGGTVAYGAVALAGLGLRVGALLGADAAAAGATEVGLLRAAGVDVRIVPLVRGPVFHNDETPAGRVQRAVEIADPVPADALPPGWSGARGWLLAPVAGELPDAWAAVPGPEALVALGWQGLLRDLAAGAPVRRRAAAASPLVARADLVGVGRDDLAPGAVPGDLLPLLRPGAILLWTEGARGGLALEAGARTRGPGGGAEDPGGGLRWDPFPARQVDPVGAGDAFLAGVLAARLAPGRWGEDGRAADLAGALRLGAAVAALTVEGPGLLGVPGARAVRERLARG